MRSLPVSSLFRFISVSEFCFVVVVASFYDPVNADADNSNPTTARAPPPIRVIENS